MERNGLESRTRDQKVGLWIGGISLFFVVSFFLAPALVESDTISGLSGRANMFDFHKENDQNFTWTDLNVYSAAIYAFGDLNCHNKHERSWSVNGNQMPVCVRDVGIFAGLALGGFVYSRRGVNRWTIRDTFLSILPDENLKPIYASNRRTLVFIAIGIICVVPLALDGFTQLLTDRESTAFLRLATGLPFGFGLGLFFAAAYSARPNKFSSAGQVRLPGNVRFQKVTQEEE
ncbi:MAG: DUF2085 domain-containing protein [Candidatus Thermoplasmatota archaeon]|nr:DUF2085 domain-containing protein [Candidatus Thermoplasmatota archaeon]